MIPREYRYPFEVFKRNFPQYNGDESIFNKCFVTFGYNDEESFKKDWPNHNEVIYLDGCVFRFNEEIPSPKTQQ